MGLTNSDIFAPKRPGLLADRFHMHIVNGEKACCCFNKSRENKKYIISLQPTNEAWIGGLNSYPTFFNKVLFRFTFIKCAPQKSVDHIIILYQQAFVGEPH